MAHWGVSPVIAGDSHAGSPGPPEDEEGGAPLRSLAPGGLGSKAVQDPLRYLARHSLTERQSGSYDRISRGQQPVAQLRPSWAGTRLPLISLLQNEDAHQAWMSGARCKAREASLPCRL